MITTFTLLDFSGFSNRFYALKSMGTLVGQLAKGEGISFCKLLGCGRDGGFGILPDFGRYAFLAVWENEAQAEAFFASNADWMLYKKRSFAQKTYFLRTSMVHGLWNGKTPFVVSESYSEEKPVAVITRATIRWRDMVRFWRDVPAVTRTLSGPFQPEFAVGVGELPFRYQATFSLWPNGKAMKAFAYQNPAHQRMVRKTKEVGWYSEELFARFVPYRVL